MANIDLPSYSNFPFDTLFKESSTLFYCCLLDEYFPVTFISPNSQQILGYNSEDFINNDQLWLERIHPEDRGQVLTSYEGLSKGEKSLIDFRFKHREGHFVWLRDEVILQNGEKGRNNVIIGTSSEITKRKRAEIKLNSINSRLEEKVRERTQSLKIREKRFWKILQLSFDAIVEVNSAGKILDCNKRATDYFGYCREELTDMHVSKLGSTHKNKLHTNILSQFTATENEVREQFFQKKDGTIFPAEVNTKKYVAEGETRLITFIRDISDRKKKEKKLRQSLEEKKVLLIEVHHRVKNNLAIITGLLQLQADHSHNLKSKESLLEISTRIHAIALVHEKLYQADSYSQIRLDKYVNEIISGITKAFNKDATNINIKKDIAPISLNINQAIPCGLLLNELLTNCFKHAFPAKDKGRINIKILEVNNFVTIKISDNGKGLPQNFDNLKEKSLGFTIIDQIVNQLNGSLRIDSNNGSCFEIKFTLA